MKTNRKMEMAGFRINNENILDLATFIYEEYDENDKLGYVEFTMDSTDDIQYEDNTLRIFTDGPLKRKKANYIGLTCKNNLKSLYINIRIFPGAYGKIKVHINGENENLVNGIYKSIEDIINSWEPQNKFVLKHYRAIGLIVGVIVFISYTIGYVIVAKKLNPKLDFVIYFILLYIPGLLLMFGAVELMYKIFNMYPAIELNTGPEHLQIEKNSRNLLYVILSLIIIPLILGLIISLIKL